MHYNPVADRFDANVVGDDKDRKNIEVNWKKFGWKSWRERILLFAKWTHYLRFNKSQWKKKHVTTPTKNFLHCFGLPIGPQTSTTTTENPFLCTKAWQFFSHFAHDPKKKTNHRTNSPRFRISLGFVIIVCFHFSNFCLVEHTKKKFFFFIFLQASFTIYFVFFACLRYAAFQKYFQHIRNRVSAHTFTLVFFLCVHWR